MRRLTEADEAKIQGIAKGIVDRIFGNDHIQERCMETEAKGEELAVMMAEMAGDETNVNEAMSECIMEAFPEAVAEDPDEDRDWEAMDTLLDALWTQTRKALKEAC